jgi:alpha-ketoglutarate-dependent taurine dioxygenase
MPGNAEAYDQGREGAIVPGSRGYASTSDLTGRFPRTEISRTAHLARCLLAPDGADADQPAARTELTDLMREVVPDLGLLVLTGLPASASDGERASRRLAALLGQILPQNKDGVLVREVRDRGTGIAEGERARYSDSRFGGHMHTDGVERPLPAPAYFTLFCVRQSEFGGALRFVHIRHVLAALASRPDVLDVLRAPFHFDRRGDQESGAGPTVAKPVLFTQGGKPAIAYFRSYIERGHEHPGIPGLTSAQIAALDALDEAVYSAGHIREDKMRGGEFAIFDNLSLLHGRTEFRDTAESPRLLLRTWVGDCL